MSRAGGVSKEIISTCKIVAQTEKEHVARIFLHSLIPGNHSQYKENSKNTRLHIVGNAEMN